MPHVHDVPMCRRLVDPAEWDPHEGGMPGDRMQWSNRACGMAALRMILLAYGCEAPPIVELLKAGVKREALTEIRGPSAWGQAHDRVPLSRVAASYTGRAVTFASLPGERTTS